MGRADSEYSATATLLFELQRLENGDIRVSALDDQLAQRLRPSL